jgi:pyruvate formate lyase activating enzyme
MPASREASAAARRFPAPGVIRGRWWHTAEDGRLQCDLCPRACRLRDGQRGFCYVRQSLEGAIALTCYGRSSGFCVDPIEKKPLHHFHPGTSVFSFGTAGCNLGCRFCQNWHISKAREDATLSDAARPDEVADAAVASGCRSVAFTYNDPVVFAEYAVDCAHAAHERGLATVAVTAGYIAPAARRDFFAPMDAANVDLKAYSERFYRGLCLGDLAPVLDTLRWLARETRVWLEITNLLIPGHNDAEDEVARLCDWVVGNLGPDVPVHFTAFHPNFRMRDVPPTPPATVARARRQALAAGLRYVYTGNVRDREGQSTWCPGCRALLIERDGYAVGLWSLGRDGRCPGCGTALPGRFA